MTVLKDNAAVPSANLTLATPGTRVQLSSLTVPCAKVFLSAGRNNPGTITVGGPTVVASAIRQTDQARIDALSYIMATVNKPIRA
jgi:hypothetical protein